MTVRTGGCACGAVRYEATGESSALGACHCGTCRRWTGGPFVALQVETLTITQGADKARSWRSSDWGERVSCADCGGTLFFKVVATGESNVAYGTLDEPEGLELAMEIFADHKPGAYGFLSESSRKLTEAEFMTLIGVA